MAMMATMMIVINMMMLMMMRQRMIREGGVVPSSCVMTVADVITSVIMCYVCIYVLYFYIEVMQGAVFMSVMHM